jgi:hypothetical protein
VTPIVDPSLSGETEWEGIEASGVASGAQAYLLDVPASRLNPPSQ